MTVSSIVQGARALPMLLSAEQRCPLTTAFSYQPLPEANVSTSRHSFGRSFHARYSLWGPVQTPRGARRGGRVDGRSLLCLFNVTKDSEKGTRPEAVSSTAFPIHSCGPEQASPSPCRDRSGSQMRSGQFRTSACIPPHGDGTCGFLR